MPFNATKFLQQVSTKPGVYQMFDEHQNVIYVGKAKNLRSRLRSYFRESVSGKTQVLVNHINDIEITVTTTEAEALLLENTLIKEHRPKYNILMRDDKSYPYLHLSDEHSYPRLGTYRGFKRRQGKYFGPYVNVKAMYHALEIIQRLFKLRPCRDSFFKNRSRPCLQYQIKRCKAPCVDLVSQEIYHQDVANAVLFLEGKNKQVIHNLTVAMDSASKNLHYEQAAQYRDLIADVRQVQQRQYVVNKAGDVDAIAVALDNNKACIAKLVFRDGHLLGNKWYFPKVNQAYDTQAVLTAFVQQHYLDDDNLPKEILLPEIIDNQKILNEVLVNKAKRSVKIYQPQRGEKTHWLLLAKKNAEQGLLNERAQQSNYQQQIIQLQQLIAFDSDIERIECFDISHTQGKNTVASCVVFNNEGALKSDYRRFNIENITPGDDYAAMKQALTRRYSRLQKDSAKLPDLLVIDGGKGQISQALQVLTELQIESVVVLGIAKGTTRKPGLETLILANENKIIHGSDHPAALTLLQFIRDEAHRFAITSHRGRRSKTTQRSILENIDGVGPKKRRDLLKYFGGLQQLKEASIEQISSVSGINNRLAERIVETLQNK